MARIYNLNTIKNTRLCIRGLVFFLLIMLAACKQAGKKITLIWDHGQATGIQIPKNLVKDVSALRIKHSLKIARSHGNVRNNILGDFEITGDNILFKPLIPLSPGLSYDILQDDHLIGHILIPLSRDKPPVLIAVYPETDTLPENLLKFYLHFSKPMRTGQSLDYIRLLDKNNDIMRNVFLNLQPELWDTSGTVLTLWLDPGRIKRDLVLNRKLGNPLKKKGAYRLVVSQKWKDNRGISLSENYTKQFVAGDRDNQIPDINTWQLNIPQAGTKAPLIINTREPLDHYLLQESVVITDNAGTIIKGRGGVVNKDQLWKFTPSSAWIAQPYKLHINARLEDMAGNNLNRVFDRDITKDKQQNKAFYDRMFKVKP